MANLLPKEYLDARWSSFVARAVSVTALALLALAAFSLIALFPSYILARANAVGPEATPSATRETQDERDELLRAQALLSHVQLFVSGTSSPSAALKNALALAPSGVTAQRAEVVAGMGGTITIEGLAGKRDALSLYRDALVKSGHYKEVFIPVDALAGVGDGAFTIELSGDF